MGILALQGDVAEHARVLEELGASAVLVTSIEDLAGLDGLVLPGGESTTISMLLGTSGLAGALSALLAEGMPAFGTCAGMILLAREVIGGRPDQVCFGAIDIVVRRNAFGRQVESFERDLRVEKLGADPFRAVFIRAPVVVQVGEGVEVMAEVEMKADGGAQGAGPPDREAQGLPGPSGGDRGEDLLRRPVLCRPVLCRQGPVMVSAFHPELAGDLRLHDMFLSELCGRERLDCERLD